MKKLCFLIACAIVEGVLSTGTLFAGSNVFHERFVDSYSYMDDTFCEFPVFVSGSSNITALVFLDDAGKPVRVLETVNHVVITFEANGKTLTATGTGGVEYEFNPDGSVSASTFGINLLLTIPTYGTVFLDTGRAEFLFDPHLHQLFHAGPARYDTAAFCGALA